MLRPRSRCRIRIREKPPLGDQTRNLKNQKIRNLSDALTPASVRDWLLKRSLERVVKDGKTVAWDAVFFVNRPGRDYYLISEGHWQDREGCGADQYAYWSFHVKTRSSSS